ncbi:MAG TPA: glycosyltransferase family 2 protein [Patescibacteria group bacterium]|nr:glycosyltransferase family 2 protein [Patescibacteria group bacterium]
MKVIVVNPTYNEAENVERLIREVQDVGKGSGYDLHQLIVDDNSPDHTAEIVKRLQKTYPKLHLVTGLRQGLGAAYVRGFKHALDSMNPDVLVQMDADFSHNPLDLPRLLREIEAGEDIVIGSRYVPGGSVPADWGWFRKINSLGASVFARFVAGIYQVHDITTGYRAIRVKEVADQVNWDRVFAKGYSFQLMSIYRLLQHTDKVREIPIQFVDRTRGESKVGLNATYFRDVLEFMRNAWLLRAKRTELLFKFLVVGGIGFLVNAFVWRTLLEVTPLGLGTAQLISGEVSIISNFLLNNFWTFAARDTKHTLRSRFIQYNLTAFVSVLIASAVIELLAYLFGATPSLRYLFIGVAVGTLWNWLVTNYWIFKERK